MLPHEDAILNRAHLIAETPIPAMERAGILLPLPLTGPYDYKLPRGINAVRGMLVAAPIGNRESLGVVWGSPEGNVGDNRLKIAEPLEGLPRLPAALCDFIDWVAAYTLNPPGAILAMALRSRNAFEPEARRIAYIKGDTVPARLSDARRRVLAVAEDGLARSVPGMAEDANVSTAVVRGLIQAGAKPPSCGIPRRLPRTGSRFARFERGNPDQARAAGVLREAVKEKRFSAHLLDGVTGSGKTEVYFEAVAEALHQGKQVMILLPEIALTVQFLERFAARFGIRPAEWHSDLSQKERRRVYRAVMAGQAQVVVGARSSLFLPFAALGLVIVDEEHEQAFKQQDGAIYHARDMAVVRARIEDCPVILASATPSLESFVNATSGRYSHLKLASRHGVAEMPEVRILDLRREKDEDENAKWLSAPLRQAMEQTLAAGEQALLFLNRRGYAPLTLCQACGHKFTCPHCSAWLVEHRYRKRLACHQCGYEIAAPSECPECKAHETLIACGPGVERVAEEFTISFPMRYAIASSDTLHGPAETQAAIAAFSKGEIDVLIGTRIIAKGHHFPQLTLVGVIDADLGNADGDIRARGTAPVLHQGVGTGGPRGKRGLVLLQTRNRQDGDAGLGQQRDRDGFYEQERHIASTWRRQPAWPAGGYRRFRR